MSNYPYQNLSPPNYPPPNNNPPGYPPTGSNPQNQNYPSNFSQPPGYPPQQHSMNQGYPAAGGYPNQGGNIAPGYPPQQIGNPANIAVCPTPGMNVLPGQPGFQPGVCPTAPDISQIEKIPGYEGITFEDAVLIPPSIPVWQPDQHERQPLPNLPVLTEEEVHEAVAQFASEHCCYGSKAAREMNLREINMMSAFHYKLETYTEKRESAWRFLPYNGQAIDGPTNGMAPSPWDVQAVPPNYFNNGKAKLEVPHTAFVKPCHTCVGNQRVRCEACLGNGRKQCTWCNGRGRRTRFDNEEICTSCNGTGTDRCLQCSATGQVMCKTCNGKGQLKGFVELTVTWINHSDDFISETSNMPKELVRSVTGQIAYEEENPRVFPITQSSDQAVCNASNELVNKHGQAFVNERILKQRQCLRVIPIGHVRYEWKEKNDEFYVFGYEHKVYFKKYPQKCGCTIL